MDNIYDRVFNKFGGLREFQRKTGVPDSTLRSIKATGRSSKIVKFCFHLIMLSSKRTIKAAAKRVALDR